MSILPWRLLLIGTGVFLSLQCVRLLPAEYFAEHARSTLRNNHPDEAARFALRGLETETQNPFLYQYLASAKLTHCDSSANTSEKTTCYEEALAALQKARTLAPWDKTFLVPLALTYDGLGRYSEAEWIFYEARHWDPKSIYLNEFYKYHLSRWRNPRPESENTGSEEPEKQ